MSERFACFASFHNDRPRLLPRPRDSRQSWRTDIPGCGGSFIVISLPPPWSMVIDQINIKSVAPIEAEYDPPGARDPHGPEALPLPFQGVQPALPVDTIANTHRDPVGRGKPRRQHPEFRRRCGFHRCRPGTPGPTGGLDHRYAQGSCRAGRAPPTTPGFPTTLRVSTTSAGHARPYGWARSPIRARTL